jgi:hyaluronoglucosaminidase
VFASENCDWHVKVTNNASLLDQRAAAVFAAAPAASEPFAVATSVVGYSTLIASDERAALYALHSALDITVPLASGRQAVEATLVDYPDIPTRGIIEGFYGPPYNSDERLSVLTRMEKLRQNRYVYGPQNDDFAHDRWAEPYPPDQALAFTAAATEAESHLIDFVWAFRPAVNSFGYSQPQNSIRFSSDTDFARLTSKIEAMRQLGVERFGLLIDDSRPQLYWPEDMAAFDSLAAAHASLANRMQQYLESKTLGAHLLFIGTKYTKDVDGWQDYNDKLGGLLDPSIEVMWTGNKTYSDSISPDDLTDINSRLHRKVTIWDNAPTSVAGLTDRSKNLYTAVSGFLSNAVMNEWRHYSVAEFRSTMGPIGVFTWNATSYDPSATLSWWMKMEIFVASRRQDDPQL